MTATMPPKIDGWSDRVRVAAWVLERFGVTTVLCAVLLVGIYGLGKMLITQVGVPMVEAHRSFLQSQVKSMERIVECQESMDEFCDETKKVHVRQTEVLEQNKGSLEEARVLMRDVPAERQKQTLLLTEIRDQLKQSNGG